MSALKAGEPEEALRRLGRVLKREPGHVVALANRALAHRALGHLDRAEADLRRAIELEPALGGAWRALAGVLAAGGQVEEAVHAARRATELDPEVVSTHAVLTNMLVQAGRAEEAVGPARAAARLAPDDLRYATALATCLYEAGRAPEAQRAFERCLLLDPQDANSHLYLGLGALDQGASRRAASHLDMAVARAPEVLPAWLALARARRELGQYDKAVAALERATTHHPGAADIPAEEGQIWLRAGEPARAEAALRRGLDLEPHHLHAAHTLGTLLGSLGQVEEALAAHRSAVATRPDATWAWIGFTDAVAAVASPPTDLGEDLLEALGREGIDHQRLERAVRAHLEQIPGVPLALEGAPLSAISRQGLLDHPLTRPWLERCIVCHPGWERLLTELRDSLLRETPGAPLLDALGVQAWHTEYAWREAPPGLPWPPAPPEVPGAEEIEVIALTDDAVSAAVRAQYEANPYPRLVSVHRKPPEPLHQLLAGLFPHFEQAPRPAALDILVAGCGTGQQALAAATRYAGAQVLAIDLSRASCAATVRRARAWGLDNLAVAQADILALHRLHRRFHLVEAGGVLHHMADPMAGWRVLTNLTEPGGLMKIGLYSEAGREGVMAARALLEEAGATTDPAGLRSARQRLLALPEGHPGREVLWSPDFYSLSGFRDLVLHVCEHRFTLDAIGEALDTLGLRLVGLQHGRPEPRAWYVERWPEDLAQTSLSRWAAIEEEYPRAFAGMYQFWAHKPTG